MTPTFLEPQMAGLETYLANHPGAQPTGGVCPTGAGITLAGASCEWGFTSDQSLATQVNNELKTLQQAVFGDIAPSGSAGSNLTSSNGVLAAANRLNGARALVDDYIELALPGPSSSDTVLRNILYGSQHLLDNNPADNEIYDLFLTPDQTTAPYPTFFDSNPLIPNGPLDLRMRTGVAELAHHLLLFIANGKLAQDVSLAAAAAKPASLTTGELSYLSLAKSLLQTDMACHSTPHKPGCFTPPPPPGAALHVTHAAVVHHDLLKLTLGCRRAVCAGTVNESTIELLSKTGRITRLVTSVKRGQHSRTVTVASHRYSVQPAHSVTLTLRPDGAALSLGHRFSTIPVIVSFTITVNGRIGTHSLGKFSLNMPRGG
jgi:hypothetical protein